MMKVEKQIINNEVRFEDLDDGAIFMVPGYDRGVFIKTDSGEDIAVDLASGTGREYCMIEAFTKGAETLVIELDAKLIVKLKKGN